MLLEGKIFSGDHVDKIAVKPVEIRENVSLTKSLDIALVELCHELTLPSLMWFSKNTREFAKYRQTIFFPEQFSEPVKFTQFQIKLVDVHE
ncbi:MAG: hypothetical protein GX145_03440 [Clostridiaceae bacterium]|jgi:hypothetical protein|nr:hypothetical protein [Bacillota bacterium]NLN51850.1 hypothetical protein [Clostridiaceae bacterium]